MKKHTIKDVQFTKGTYNTGDILTYIADDELVQVQGEFEQVKGNSNLYKHAHLFPDGAETEIFFYPEGAGAEEDKAVKERVITTLKCNNSLHYMQVMRCYVVELFDLPTPERYEYHKEVYDAVQEYITAMYEHIQGRNNEDITDDVVAIRRLKEVLFFWGNLNLKDL